MPLFRIESRPKGSEEETAPRRARPASVSPPRESRGSVAPAVMAGAMLGVLVVAGAIAVMVGMRSAGTAAPPPAVMAPPATADGAPAAVGAVAGAAASLLPSADPNLPFINFDYPREAIVALVNGQPFTMGQLETAVRVGRALAALSGDPVPDYDTPEMRDFQIQMLRRQVDVVLMRQAFRAAGLEDPSLPIEGLTSGFLERVGATQERLEQAMSENGVRQADLDAWFADSQQVNLFVQQQLMQGRDQAERNQVTRDWLDRQWASGDIFVNFYDPDMPASGFGSDPAGASTEGDAGGGASGGASPVPPTAAP